MMTDLMGLVSKWSVTALADLDISGWLVGTEVRSAIASLFASIWTAFASVFLNGIFGGGA